MWYFAKFLVPVCALFMSSTELLMSFDANAMVVLLTVLKNFCFSLESF